MKKFMYFAAALLVLVGCNKKDNSIENTPQEVVTIKGGIVLPQTPNKIAPAEGWQTATEPFQMLWEEGDQIYIWNQAAPNNGQVFTLIDGAGTSEGTFSGTKLEDMSEYFVSNVGQIGLGEYTVEYVENNFRHPYISCIGHENSFSIYNFGAVIGLQLKGSVTLSKIEVEMDLGGGMMSKFTMPFEGGLALNNTTATKVYIPVDAPGELETETISFYVGDEVIMSKTLTEEEQLPVQNTVTTYPELEVKAATPTVDPKDIFDEGAKMNFKLTFDAGWNIYYYEFNYTNNGSGFTCDKIIENNNDVTLDYASMCPVTLTGNYTFHFQLGPNFILDYDGANKTYKCGGEYSLTTTITDFKVNDVSIFDQLTDITGQN